MIYGLTLSSEEFSTPDLVRHAAQAEQAGFDFVGISDHFSPWINQQGHSPFVWTTVGAISQVTKTIEVFIEVTCPIIRIHPAILAQAAATAATLLEGRFAWGLGTGENLNEHVVGEGWPHLDVRQQMLHEAVEIIRQLWSGETVSYYGNFYTVEAARIYTLPKVLPPLVISALGPESAELAGQLGDGLVGTAPDAEPIKAFQKAGGQGKPVYGQLSVCYSADKTSARQTAFAQWPVSGVQGQLMSELRLPEYFEDAVKMLTEESATKDISLGPEPAVYLESVEKYRQAGYDHVYFHQIGPDQAGFMEFFKRELKPKLP